MILYTILIAIGLILIMAIAWLVGRSQQKNAVQRFSRKFGLEVPEGMEPVIRAGVMARHTGALVGTIITEVIAVVVLLVFPGFQLLSIWWTLFASYLVGAGVGSAVAILFAERKREQGVIRVARMSTVTIDDYVPPLQSWFSRICVVLGILAFAGDIWLTVGSSAAYLSPVSGVLVGLAIVMLVVYEIVSRRSVSKGALAGSTLELAWDDGLRSYALSNLNIMVALIPLYSLIGYDTLWVNGPYSHIKNLVSQPALGVYGGLLPIGASVLVLCMVAIVTRIRARQYFLRRLWPSLATKVDDNVAGAYTSMMGN
ncbi:MAG TPA: hypothetical protein VIJ11_01600 [Galbitalea sp.]